MRGTATPSFVYGLAGADTINGAGMTGRLSIVGGAGADKMTGGSGVNVYLYGAASDSTAAAADTISNFAVARDPLVGVNLGLQGQRHRAAVVFKTALKDFSATGDCGCVLHSSLCLSIPAALGGCIGLGKCRANCAD